MVRGLLVRGARRPLARPHRSGPHLGRPGSGALGLWGDRGVVGVQRDPLEVGRGHFSRVTGAALTAGHFLAEECPDEVLTAVSDHIAG